MQTIDVYDQENRRDTVSKESNTQNEQNVSEMGCQKMLQADLWAKRTKQRPDINVEQKCKL